MQCYIFVNNRSQPTYLCDIFEGDQHMGRQLYSQKRTKYRKQVYFQPILQYQYYILKISLSRLHAFDFDEISDQLLISRKYLETLWFATSASIVPITYIMISNHAQVDHCWLHGQCRLRDDRHFYHVPLDNSWRTG